jgi:hypothetical protein
MAELTSADLEEIRHARQILEHPSLAIRLADLVGKPISELVKALPDGAQKTIATATTTALEKALDVALRTLDASGRSPAPDWLHRAAVVATGAAGGAAGLAGLAFELPVSLTVMLRSIASHARAQGEDLGSVATRLECLTVFAYGSGTDDASESAYWISRAALGRAVASAAEYVADRGLAEALSKKSTPALVQLLARISQRFGLAVSDKAAAQFVPLIGAAGGAAINTLFINHFQATAKAHFSIRRLERAYGEVAVRRAYERGRG